MSGMVLAGIWKKVSRGTCIRAAAKAQNSRHFSPSEGDISAMIRPVSSTESG
jgi:hypothetical protein